MTHRILCTTLLLATSMAAHAQALPPPADQALAHDILKEMVEIKSGFTSGATTPVAQAAAARLRAAGFPEADLFLGGAIPTKLNLVARLHGTGARKPLLLLAHTDVVEANPKDWTSDPYIFTERQGSFFGRGVADDKGQAAVWLETLIRLKREHFTPDRDIILALTADEEGAGPYDGVIWLLKNHRELIDAEYALNEGGYGELVHGHRNSNEFQASEKYVINFHLEVHNKGGHSSVPVADNAIYHLAGALTRLAASPFPLKTGDATAAYFARMQALETGPAGEALQGFSPTSQASLERAAAASPTWNSMLRTTCVATQLEGGVALNALPPIASANVNCRVLPDDSPEYVQATLKRVFADDQVAVTILGDVSQGPASPLNPALLAVVTAATTREWPGVPVVPTLVPYATDGRFLRAAGIPTYGVQGFFLDRDHLPWHSTDESVGVAGFYEAQAFMYDVVKTLSTP